MKVEFTPEQKALREELRAYFAELMTPELKAENERTMGEGGGPLWREALRKMGADGWIGLGWPKELGGRGLCRILLLHHPPKRGSIRWRKRLTDARALEDVIARHGVEMVLHGHAHRHSMNWLPTPAGRTPILGTASASDVGMRPGRRHLSHGET